MINVSYIVVEQEPHDDEKLPRIVIIGHNNFYLDNDSWDTRTENGRVYVTKCYRPVAGLQLREITSKHEQ